MTKCHFKITESKTLVATLTLPISIFSPLLAALSSSIMSSVFLFAFPSFILLHLFIPPFSPPTLFYFQQSFYSSLVPHPIFPSSFSTPTRSTSCTFNYSSLQPPTYHTLAFLYPFPLHLSLPDIIFSTLLFYHQPTTSYVSSLFSIPTRSTRCNLFSSTYLIDFFHVNII